MSRSASSRVRRACAASVFLASTLVGAASAQSPRLVLDAAPGAAGSMANTIFSIAPGLRAGEVFLVLDDGVHGAELWRSNGTAAGTSMVVDLTPGAAGTPFGTLQAQADGLWFVIPAASSSELWRSDGTAAGTSRILDGAALGVTDLTTPLFRFADGSFVLDLDGVLARSDGTAGGTRTLGVPAGRIYDAGAGSLWVFDSARRELWSSDGSSASGTIVATGVGSVAAAFGGLLIGRSTPSGGSALQVLGVTPAPQATLPEPVQFWSHGDAIVAFGTSGLWRWDGRNAPVQLGSFTATQDPFGGFFAFARDGRSLLFFPDDGVHGFEPWWTDGTVAGTRLLADLTPGSGSTSVAPGFSLEDRIMFWADTPGIGSEPWATDGTAAGTVLIGDLEPGPGSSIIDAFGGTGGVGYRRVVMPIATSAFGNELWVSDGTSAGTRSLGDLNPGPASAIQPYGYWSWYDGSALIVAVDDGTHGLEPYAIDFVATSQYLFGGCSPTARYEAHDPVLGTPWQLAAHRVAGSGFALVARPASTPLRLGFACAVQLDPASSVVVATITPNAAGDWSGTLPLPGSTALVGARVVTQAAFLEPTLPLGFAIGDAWIATLGF